MNKSNMTQENALDFLIKRLLAEDRRYANFEIPTAYAEKRSLLRSLMNVRPARPISEEFLEIQDKLLSEETREKGIVDGTKLKTVLEDYPNSTICHADKLYLWQGDICTLNVDAIVNAANDQLLGCFVPGHFCIDNAIHSAAGIQLRLECDEIIRRQGHPEETGKAKITSAYNLPCKYVLHTVGPIITGSVTANQFQQLADCYRSCLELAAAHNVKTIAFCCISTGAFHFPPQKAAEIAVKTVCDFLDIHGEKIERVLFNVFSLEDYTIYRNLLE
ncbi:protein-ADP-ribose hydrolase [Desulfitobacterium sp. Sab5]|uniref:protein-ADP-ribose hydrolase n=1 Tax=Desulfitobacterium nosdiversum TaxID=3375356 RepID=UPI003CEB9AFA